MFRFAVLLLVALCSINLVAQDDSARRKAREQFAKLQALTQPGPEHAELKKLAGSWQVSMTPNRPGFDFTGHAELSMVLGDRFLVIDGDGKTGNRESAFRYTIGFDRRHDEFTIILMDTSGTYAVSARGKRSQDGLRMFGTDDDPHMKQLGFEKKFAFDLEIENEDRFSITTIYIDTRTPEEMPRPAFSHVFTRVKR